MIRVEHVSREFKISVKGKGFFKDLFSRDFKHVAAVSDISFNVEEGEIVGFIGANGAGKSTTIKMLTGILTPTKGVIEVNGLVPHLSRTKLAKDIGVVFGQRSQLWWDLPVCDSFELLKKIYKIDDVDFKENVTLFNKTFGLHEFYNKPVRQLSLGQKMRAEICAALLHNPKILFLDEPTIGLDVLAKSELRLMLLKLKKERNITIILTTHDMGDVQEVCERLIIIDRGKVIFDDKLEALQQLVHDNELVEIIFDKDVENFYIPNLNVEKVNGIKYIIELDRSLMTYSELFNNLIKFGKIHDIKIRSNSIEEIVKGIYLGSVSATRAIG